MRLELDVFVDRHVVAGGLSELRKQGLLGRVEHQGTTTVAGRGGDEHRHLRVHRFQRVPTDEQGDLRRGTLLLVVGSQLVEPVRRVLKVVVGPDHQVVCGHLHPGHDGVRLPGTALWFPRDDDRCPFWRSSEHSTTGSSGTSQILNSSSSGPNCPRSSLQAPAQSTVGNSTLVDRWTVARFLAILGLNPTEPGRPSAIHPVSARPLGRSVADSVPTRTTRDSPRVAVTVRSHRRLCTPETPHPEASPQRYRRG